MPQNPDFKLSVKLSIMKGAKAGANYDATVSVMLYDGCFKVGDLVVGPPKGMGILPENLYLTFQFTYQPGSHIAQEISKSIPINIGPGTANVVAIATVDGKVAGEASQPSPVGGIHMG